MRTEPDHPRSNAPTRHALTYSSAQGLLRAVASLPEVPGFHVERFLKQGGSGKVYRGTYVRTGAIAAIKVIDHVKPAEPALLPTLSHDTPDEQAAGTGDWPSLPMPRRVALELDALMHLQLDDVPALLGHGVLAARAPDVPHRFIATAFVDGHSLTEHATVHTFDRRARAELMAKVADAIQRIHEHGFIHRDVKPSNILINKAGQPRIIDFGITMGTEANPTLTITADGAAIGTPAYMAPEQARGDRAAITTRTDVHGLGATAYELFTGRTPHAFDDPKETTLQAIHRVATEPPRRARDIDPSLPKALDAVLAKAVATNPHERYESPAALAGDLRRWLAGEPVEAQQPRVREWIVRAIRRHPVWLTAAACGTILAATGLGMVLGHGWLRAPAGVTIDGEHRRARLVSVAGGVLHVWNGEQPGGIAAHGFVPTPSGGLALIGRRLAAGHDGLEHDGELCAYDAKNPTRLVWSRGRFAGVTADLKPPVDFGELPPEPFVCEYVLVADVFPVSSAASGTGEANISDEIIAIHNHSSKSASCVRIYGVDGQVLYEAWHDGRLTSACWDAGQRRLVLAGVNSELEITARDPAVNRASKQDPLYPCIVFALAPTPIPMLGRGVHEPAAIIRASNLHDSKVANPAHRPIASNESGEPGAHGDLIWYHAILPLTASSRYAYATLDASPRRFNGQPYMRLKLWDFKTAGIAGYLRFDREGRVLGEPIIDATHAASTGATALPSLWLGLLPPAAAKPAK